MGKLRFTLVNLWFWATMILMNFLTENLPLSGSSKDGFGMTALILISLSAFLCMFMFYFINHKNNKITVDWILLPSISFVGLVFLIAIWIAKPTTYTFLDGTKTIEVSLSLFEKFRASVILLIFLAFTYAYMFVMRVNALKNRQFFWLIYAGIITAYISLVASIIMERESYALIFKTTNSDALPNISIHSFYTNKNYYGGVLFVGFLACIAANYYKPRFFNYLSMLVLFIGTLASASMLPTIISMVALPVYLLEEIVRFAIKKKWLPCIFAIIVTFLAIAIVLVFYAGSQLHWNGFVGLDEYISKVFSSKNFTTLTGRVTIWKNIYIYIFDQPLYTIFGHGFMVSEKYILAITAVMNNSVEGVRTTHNGYVQIVFEYGLFGAFIYLVLMGYFIYGCIRLLLEKRFHYVFVYAFIVLCCSIYNMAESSSFFDSGVKEMFITIAFIMPIIGDTKALSRRKKIMEIKSIKERTKPANYMKLGKGLAVINYSVVLATALMFICIITLKTGWIRYLMLNILIGSIISLIFIPYLITLFYRNTDRPIFILHSVGNALLLGFMIFLFIFVMSRFYTLRRVMPYAVPMVIVVTLVSQMTIYYLVKGGSLKEWWTIVFHGSILIPRYASFGAIGLGGLAIIITQVFNPVGLFTYWFLYGLAFIGFYMVLHFLPTREGKAILNEYNEFGLSRVHKIYLKDEKYYG